MFLSVEPSIDAQQHVNIYALCGDSHYFLTDFGKFNERKQNHFVFALLNNDNNTANG